MQCKQAKTITRDWNEQVLHHNVIKRNLSNVNLCWYKIVHKVAPSYHMTFSPIVGCSMPELLAKFLVPRGGDEPDSN